MLRFAILALVCSLFSSCGYHLGETGGIFTSYRSLSVPYIEGDHDGLLTEALIRECASNSRFSYLPDDGDLLLCVRIVDFRDENIGFRYDRDKNNILLKDVVQHEGRLSLLVEVEVYDGCSGVSIFGPKPLGITSDYDYGLGKTNENVLAYSLGQVDTQEEAYEIASVPAYRTMARKIVEYINYAW